MKRYFKILSLILSLILVLSTLTPLITSVRAEDAPTHGKLTINKKDAKDPHNPINGVTFTVYKVDDDYDSKDIPTEYNSYVQGSTDSQNGKLYKASQVTADKGQAVFDNLPLGRYLVIEEEAPDEVPERTANFLIDIPRTKEDGQTLEYNVEVSPKNTIILEDYAIEKKDSKTGTGLDGVTFKLQRKGADDNYTDYKPDKGDTTLTTAGGGKATWDNLPVGEYQIVETDTADGYILDDTKTYKFKVYYEDGQSGIKIVDDEGNETPYEKTEPTIIKNEKPELKKTIVTPEHTGNTVEFNLKVDVPTVIDKLKTFKITDTMNEGLKYVASSLKINNVTLTANDDYTVTEEGKKITIEFLESGKTKLKSQLYSNLSEETELEQIDITYKAHIIEGKQNVNDAYKNSASLTYSTKTTVETEPSDTTKETLEDETPVLGGFKIKKTDGKNSTPLAGAEFKIALTEDDAKKEKYLQDENGEDIVLKSADSTGLAEYYGLTYGTYYLVEVKAPVVGGVSYNLLREPKPITVSATSYEGDEIEVKNRKGFLLPETGGMGTILIFAVGFAFIGGAIILHKKGKEAK